MGLSVGNRSWQKPGKQQVQLVESTEIDLKRLVAEAVVAEMDAWEVKKKAEEKRRVLGQLMVKSMPHKTNRFSVLETSTVTSTKDMLNPLSVTIYLRTKQVMPKQPPLQPSEDPFLVQSTSLKRGTDVSLHLSTVDSNTAMFVKVLVNSGATGMFIDIEFVRLKNIQTHWLPRTITVYNVNGAPNKARHITKVVDLMVQKKDNSEGYHASI